ncbi:hypothetical protein D3C87_2019370 [compost metagenome]
MPVKLMVTDRNEVAPSTNMIIAVSRVADIRLSQNAARVSEPPAHASPSDATTPYAAASVAVA